MATNNSTNLSDSGTIYYDGAGSYTGVDITDNDVLVGKTSSAPTVMNTFMMSGLNCWYWNLSFTHSAGTLTIAGADGTALSTSNPAYLVMPSNAIQGRLAQFKITANVALTVSDMTGNTGTITAGDAYTVATQIPLFIGFMADSSDDNLVGVVTWAPNVRISPSTSTNIGDPSAANADETYSVFSMSDITESSYTSKQVGLIGSVVATADTSTVYTLSNLNYYTGIGRFCDKVNFHMWPGLYGNGTASIFQDNGGTAPTFDKDTQYYQIQTDGRCQVFFGTLTITGAGVGANDTVCSLPFEANLNSMTYQYIGSAYCFSGSLGNIISPVFLDPTYPKGMVYNDAGTLSKIQINQWNSGSGANATGGAVFLIRGIE